MSYFMSYQERSESYFSAAEAKRELFLTPGDLAAIPSFKEGGWGNNTRLFSKKDVVDYALSKYGKDTLEKKLQSRAKREEKKRAREELAKEYEAQLGLGGGKEDEEEDEEEDDDVQIISGGGGGGGGGVGTAAKKPRLAAPAPSPVSAEDEAASSRLLAEVRRSFKALLTWDYLRSKRAEHGTNGTVTLERVEQKLYAILIGRGRDPQLLSLPKVGAWYTAQRDLESLFGEDVSIRGSGGKFNSNSNLRLGVEGNESLTFKYRPASQTLTVSFQKTTWAGASPPHTLSSLTHFPPFLFLPSLQLGHWLHQPGLLIRGLIRRRWIPVKVAASP